MDDSNRGTRHLNPALGHSGEEEYMIEGTASGLGNLQSQEVWDRQWGDTTFRYPPKGDQVAGWVTRALAGRPPGSCVEIGCFPGQYLGLLGRMGYELNGVDLTPRTSEIAARLRAEGFSVGRLERADFFSWTPAEQYDVVFSNGFIEHFSEWREVLLRHARLVRPGGLLIVATPNFKGAFQNWFHRLLDRENYDRHYIPSMDPSKWTELLEAEGFDILQSGYFAQFDIWIGPQRRNLFQKLVFWTLRALVPVLRHVFPGESAAFAPYCGVVARSKASRAAER